MVDDRSFHEMLREQLDLLESSCRRYDDGHLSEAINIAARLRVICHSSYDKKTLLPLPKHTSLLAHLNAETLVRLLTTADKPPPGAKFFPALTTWNMTFFDEGADAEVKYMPKLGTAKYAHLTSFINWWQREVIYLNLELHVAMTRRDLVLSAANQDGGAHVDADLDAAYKELRGGLGWTMTINRPDGTKKDIPFENAHRAGLRQLGYEVLNSPAIADLSRIPKTADSK
jgi:hypothetical protein